MDYPEFKRRLNERMNKRKYRYAWWYWFYLHYIDPRMWWDELSFRFKIWKNK